MTRDLRSGPKPGWLGRDEVGGVPSQTRSDLSPPPHWRPDAVYATARPHHLSVSPDGNLVAFVLDLEGTSDLWSVSLDSGNLRRITTNRGPTAYWEDSAPVWSPDGTRLAYNSEGHVTVVSVAGGPPRRLVPGSTGVWLDNSRLAVSVERDRCSRLALIDVDDPWPAPVGPVDGDVGKPNLTGDGRLLALFWPKDDLSRSDIIALDPDGTWETLVRHPGRRASSPVVRNGTMAYALEGGEWAEAYLCDLTRRNHRRHAWGQHDLSDLAWSGRGDGLIAVATSHGRSDLVSIDDGGSVQVLAQGGTWQTPVVSRDGIVAIHESFDSPARIVLIDPEGTHRTLYDGAPASVRTAPHAKMERIVYQSGDGMEIEGFLFRPADTTRPVAAVVYPHGGPTSLYGDEWDGHAQYFVDKGYAWLAINFRGSTSYGLTFERANHGDWGVGDVDDCIAAAHYLAGLDWVDGDRIAIFGASYGSYLALASLVRRDTPYVCAVAKYGDCDILTSWAQGDREGVEDLERMMGHPSQNRAAYHAGSPIHDIGRIKGPIFIAHGERDARVHPKQSEQLVAALDEVGAIYEYVTYPTEGHGFLRREPQLHFYRRLERFLDWYLM